MNDKDLEPGYRDRIYERYATQFQDAPEKSDKIAYLKIKMPILLT